MSYYSFSIRAASIAALAAAAMAQLDVVCETQPVHARDRDAALKNLDAHATLVGEPLLGEELVASMHGSISTRSREIIEGQPPEVEVTSAGSGCNVYRQAATAQV